MAGQEVALRLQELDITLPEVAPPVASYVPAVQVGEMIYTSGQLPFIDGALPLTGLVSNGVTTDRDVENVVTVQEATALARTSTLNALAAVHSLVGLENVEQIVKVTGFVASAPGFTRQPEVINGASEVLGEIFGSRGVHARSAVGVAELPLGSPVEVELIVKVKNQETHTES